jgi:endonuclease/exonuclease/phosphatase family metal-dependent hydrolase
MPDTKTPSGTLSFTVGTWNLHNFSKWGDKEFRLDDIADRILELDLDVLAVQELKVKDGTEGEGAQAFDALLEKLPAYKGVHAPWDAKDSTVGLLYKSLTVTMDDWDTLFEFDWKPFPRPPVEASLTVTKNKKSAHFSVVVLHLKAFKDSVDRRREACKKLVEYVEKQSDQRYLIIGDFNDDPYDSESSNSYYGTFLDNEPDFHFVTASLPKGTVTSTGYYTWVDGKKMDGEFLDHAVLTGEMFSEYTSVTAKVLSVPSSALSQWIGSYSDHFPVVLEFKSE